MISTLGYGLGSALCLVLPARGLYGLADALADACFLVRRRARRAVCANLRVVLGPGVPEQEVRARGRRVFRNFARQIVDFMRLSRLGPEELSRAFVVEGREHLEAARRDAPGAVLFLTAHLGNWEWGAAWLGQRGELNGVVAKRHPARAVERFFSRCRAASGLRVFLERDSARDVVGSLRAGESVAMLVDRDITRDGLRAQFFGRPARVPRAHVSLALRTGATILPGFVVHEPDGRLRLIFEPPMDPRSLGGVRGGVQACLAILEKYIRRYPDQWLVFEPVWPEAA